MTTVKSLREQLQDMPDDYIIQISKDDGKTEIDVEWMDVQCGNKKLVLF